MYQCVRDLFSPSLVSEITKIIHLLEYVMRALVKYVDHNY